MAQELGESREAFGRDVWTMVEDFANNMKDEEKPFYIVYACKEDKPASYRFGRAVFRQAIKAYYDRPPAILGILVWYVDNSQGKFEFVSELSAPPDIPLDPNLLSKKESDSFARVAEQGKKLNVLLS